jgi:predicted PurR-regulated permease PerM
VSAGDLAAIIVSFISIATVVALVLVVQSMQRMVKRLSETVEQLQAEAMPVIEELRSSVQRTNDDLDRVDDLIGSAEAITTTVEGASRLAYLTVSKPVIKTMALAAGTQRAARRLRGEALTPAPPVAVVPSGNKRGRGPRRRRAG